MAHCVYLGETGYNFQKSIIYLSMKIYLALGDCADPDEMPRMHFIWVFTISSVFSFSFEEKKSKSVSVLNNTRSFSFFVFF